MSTRTKTFTLSEPLEGHETIRELVFREPRFSDLMVLGEPSTVTLTDDGRPFVVENTAVIMEYLRRCIISPTDFLTVEAQLNYADGMALKTWMQSFLAQGDRGREASSTSPKSSGLTVESTPA